MLADDTFEIPELADTDVLPAFNVQGTVQFQSLQGRAGNVTEQALRVFWTAYILTLSGWHLVHAYGHAEGVEELRTALRESGLPEVPTDRPRPVWSAVSRVFGRLAYPTSVEGSIGLGDGLPTVEGRLEYAEDAGETAEREAGTTYLDSDRILQAMLRLLEAVDRRCWVMFDRLDEAFEDDPTLERLALRALMRAHSNLSSYGHRFRTKLFLRNDILDRVTSDSGFVNITHLRSMNILWTRQHILDLIVKRLIADDAIGRFFVWRNVEGQHDALRAILPQVNESSGRRKPDGRPDIKLIDPLSYILEKSTDGSQAPNPRNVVHMIGAARAIQLRACELNDPELRAVTRDTPISQDTLTRAWHQLSNTRLVDTLYAEHNGLRWAIERFRNGPQGFTESHLRRLFADRSEVDRAEIFQKLKYCGFMRQSGRAKYRIPDLFRPALELNPHGPGRNEPLRLQVGLEPSEASSTISTR